MSDEIEPPWQSHEIDIAPDAYFAEVERAKSALAVELKRHEEAMKPLERRVWELEHSSFYQRSKMRAKYPPANMTQEQWEASKSREVK